MIYLLLAILSSALVSIFMRLSDKHIKNNMTMFMSNYFLCMILSSIFGLQTNLQSYTNELLLPIGLGIFSGIMYLGSFMLLQTNINRNGVVLSATFMKLGVIVPTLMAILIFHERFTIFSILGIIIALVAIIIINYSPINKKENQSSQLYLLIILLLAGGFTDSLSNIYEKCGVATLKDLYLLCTFFSALLCSIIMKFVKKQKITLIDLVCGALIGIPNYFSARFLLLSLSKMQAIIVFPVYNIGTIIIVTLTSLLLFHEKLSKQKWIAILLIVLSLILLNI